MGSGLNPKHMAPVSEEKVAEAVCFIQRLYNVALYKIQPRNAETPQSSH